MFNIIELYQKTIGQQFQLDNDDAFVDKLSRKYSFGLMIIIASIIAMVQLVGEPITCWCPDEYSTVRCNYAVQYCYITSFYIPVGNTSGLPKMSDLKSHKIMYYQWIQYIFLLHAILFYLPCILWYLV
jgi:innexin